MNTPPSIVVLAAGAGRRFGAAGPKLAQRLGDGTLLGHTLAHAIETRWPVVVVTTQALVPLVAPWIATRDLVVMTEQEAARGVGRSIAAGVAAHADAGGWLLLPADMPLITSATIVAVGRALADSPVACSQYNGRRGHPVGFATELFSDLVELEGDEGARRLLARYPALGVEVDDPGVLVDIDTEDDLADARAAVSVT